MSNNTQPNSQTIQQNSVDMSIQNPQGQPRDKQQQQNILEEKKQKKANTKRKQMENNEKDKQSNERDKQKAEFESSRNELKSLLSQYGTKAKVADDLDRDTSKLRGNIESLLARTQGKLNKPIQVTPPPLTTTTTTTPNILTIIWRNLTSIASLPSRLLLGMIRSVYNSINWTALLLGLLLIELVIIFLIWAVKRSHHTYLYVEPYEPVVHGTYGVDQPISWRIVWSIINSIQEFFAEVMNGGRGFGSPSYDGLVPI